MDVVVCISMLESRPCNLITLNNEVKRLIWLTIIMFCRVLYTSDSQWIIQNVRGERAVESSAVG